MDVDKFIVRARQALRKRNPPQAIALAKQVLVAKPGHPDAREVLLQAYLKKVELKGGPGMLDRSAAKAARAVVAPLRGTKRAEALVKACDAGLERDPTDATLVAALAEGLETLGYQGAALAAWMFRLELDGGDAEALKAAGKLHWALRQIDEAVDCLERAHRIDPRDPETEKLRKNLAAEGTLKSTHYETARSSRELVRDKGAMKQAERRQRIHRTEDELGEDIAGLEAAVTAGPDDVDARRRLVRALIRGERHERAAEVVEEALAASPGAEAWIDLRGEVALARAAAAVAGAPAGEARKAARLAQARVEFEEYGRRVVRDPKDPALRVSLARAAYRTGETDTAIEHFQAAVQDPRFKIEAQQGLGAAFFRKGLFPLAARQLEAALEGAGGVTGDRGKEICYHLGLVCERQGDTSGALARYLQVFEVDIGYRDVAQKVQELEG